MSWLPARFDHGEKFSYYEALVVALEKNCNTFSRLYLYFYTFSRSGKMIYKFQDFFRNSGL